MNYLDKLRESSKEYKNVACMGLDPVLDVFPYPELKTEKRIPSYFETLFKEMKKRGTVPAAFKPNIGYYSILDKPREGEFSGSLALKETLDLLSLYFPNIPVILDAKRGDIAKSSLNYAYEAFSCWKTDAVTVSPYMGSDSVIPFAFLDKGVYILDRTSNKGALDFQSRSVLDRIDEREIFPLYMAVSHKIVEWANDNKGLGAVVGATSLDELEEIASYYSGKEIPMLIPGVGSQGGSALMVIEKLENAGYELELSRINSSSGLTHPWKKGKAPENAVEESIRAIKNLVSEAAI